MLRQTKLASMRACVEPDAVTSPIKCSSPYFPYHYELVVNILPRLWSTYSFVCWFSLFWHYRAWLSLSVYEQRRLNHPLNRAWMAGPDNDSSRNIVPTMHQSPSPNHTSRKISPTLLQCRWIASLTTPTPLTCPTINWEPSDCSALSSRAHFFARCTSWLPKH